MWGAPDLTLWSIEAAVSAAACASGDWSTAAARSALHAEASRPSPITAFTETLKTIAFRMLGFFKIFSNWGFTFVFLFLRLWGEETTSL